MARSSSSRCLRRALKRPTRIDGGGFAISLPMGLEANPAGLGFSGGRIMFCENINKYRFRRDGEVRVRVRVWEDASPLRNYGVGSGGIERGIEIGNGEWKSDGVETATLWDW